MLDPGQMEALMHSFYVEQSEGGSRIGCPDTGRLLSFAYDAGERDPDADLKRHVESCSFCLGDLARYRSAGGIWDVPVLRRPFRLFGLHPAPILATAALCLLVLGVVGLWPAEKAGPDSDRFLPKGSFIMKVAAERGGQVFRVAPRTRLADGDRLGFFYSSDSVGQLMIFFVGEAGELTRLHPSGRAGSQAMPAGQNQRIPDGAILSPARACEWIVALRSGRPFAEAEAASLIAKMFEQRVGCKLPTLDDARQLDAQVVEIRR